MSAFYGFEIAKTGLFYNQKALDVLAHNVANADTKGYARQRIVSSSIEPNEAPSRIGSLYYSAVGGGVRIQSIDQIRNHFLDRQYRNEVSLLGEWEVKTEVLGYIESLFNEPSDTGIYSAINEFFKAIEELSKNAGSKDIRTNLLQQAISLTETINHYDRQLLQLQEEQDYALSVSISKFNDLIDNITALNERIARYELSGQTANDLRDKRNLMLDELAEYANITYSESIVNNQSVLTVKVRFVDETGNTRELTIIDHDKSNKLVAHRESGSDFIKVYIESNEEDAVDIGGVSAIKVANFTTGRFKGYLDMRDGNSSDNKGIQYFIQQLDTLAEHLINDINNIHKLGYTYPDPSDPNAESINGILFFDGSDAGDIRVHEEIMKNVFNIAASSEKIDGHMNSGNNEILIEILKLRESKNIEQIHNFEDFIRSFVAELGVATGYANNMYSNQNFLLSSIETQRESVSGVNLDEEMANMVKYEKSYQAAARLISALDEMLEVLINRTGVVGR